MKLKEQVQYEIEQAESYLDSKIRPRITENWEYYDGVKPGNIEGEASFVSNDSSDTVDHYVATCVDAFNSDDTLEIRPQGVTNPMTLKVINRVINDILENENNRYQLYQSFFTDAFVSSASILKPHRKVQTDIDSEFFEKVPEEQVYARLEALEQQFDKVELNIDEESEEVIQHSDQVPPESVLGSLTDIKDITIEQSQTFLTGSFKKYKEKATVKIEHIPAENFIINEDAKSIEDARIVGHKARVMISDLLDDFDYDKIKEVAEHDAGPAFDEVMAARTDYIQTDSYDDSTKEVDLYELYIKSSFESEEDVAEAKLYKVFFCNNVILDYEEVDFIPYAGTSVIPRPFVFWGSGIVDRVKQIQRANSGLVRQQLTYNELVNKPKFQYVREQIVNPSDLVNPAPGTGIAVKTIGNAIAPLQVQAASGDNLAMMQYMNSRRESATGMVTTGQSLMGEALKSGASTISASMILTEDQMFRKSVIRTMLECAIKVLIKNIYELLRDEFTEWPVTIENETIIVNPNQWPKIEEIRVVTPLGASAKLEKAANLESEYQRMSLAQGDSASLFSPEGMKEILKEIYELRDIPQVSNYLNTAEQMNQKNQILAAVQALTQQAQQTQAQVAQLTQQLSVATAQNNQLTITAGEMAQRELALKEAEQQRRNEETEAKLQNLADEQTRKDEETEAKLQNMADQQSLKEEQFKAQ